MRIPSGSAAVATPCCSCCCRMKGRKLARSKRPSKQRSRSSGGGDAILAEDRGAAGAEHRRGATRARARGPLAEEIPASPAAERPLRFVWTMDADERFNLAAPTFAEAMGPRTADAIGKPWREIAAELGLDAEGRFANAVAARDTFSGIVLAWPAASGPVSVELSGLADLRSRAHLQGLSRLRRVPRRRTAGTEGTGLHSPSKQRLLRPHQQSRRRSRSVRSSRSCRRRRTWCRFRAPPTNALPFRRLSARPSWRSARP